MNKRFANWIVGIGSVSLTTGMFGFLAMNNTNEATPSSQNEQSTANEQNNVWEEQEWQDTDSTYEKKYYDEDDDDDDEEDEHDDKEHEEDEREDVKQIFSIPTRENKQSNQIDTRTSAS